MTGGHGEVQFEFSYDEGELAEEILTAMSRAIVLRALELTALQGLRTVKILSPVNHGRLAGSWQMQAVDEEEYRITTDTHYAETLHRGTDPYEILPVNKQALYWPGADHPVKRVMHPGIPRNTYIDDTITDMENMTGQLVAQALRETIP